MQITVGELHELLGGTLRFGAMPPCDGEAAIVGSIATDSRTIKQGEVFWGLAGPNFDGSIFAEEALIRGASGTVVSGRRIEPWAGRWAIELKDSHRALWQVAAWNRGQYTAPLVAVTGSVGKTTTRQMIDCVLRTRLNGSVSPRNYNNHVGVPLSLLQLERWHQYAAIELAATKPGEIGELARLAKPTIGVITRIGDAHLGTFGSTEGIAAAKSELLAELPADGIPVLNGDDPLLRRAVQNCRRRIIWIGSGPEVDCQAEHVRCNEGRLRFDVAGQAFDVSVWGRHHLTSALAAIAVGRLFDFGDAEIAAALTGFEAVSQRCEVSQSQGATIVNDTYNSSPMAMRAALELLREIDVPGRRIVIVGDMGDLGRTAADWHRRLGEDVVNVCGADLMIACGQHASQTRCGATAAGMPRDRAAAYKDWQQALAHVSSEIESGDAVLVKGARVMGLERLVESLKTKRINAAA
jgi:UDP-N-acetylmuramoyl-tripeptide--D-alanyl-D-alanine ligase